MSEAFYSHARLYDLMFPGGGPAVDFYRAGANRQGGRVLELGCGTGHKLIPIASDGHPCVGLDFSSDMLAEAQRKADERGVAVEWVQGDMRAFDLGRTFDFVFITANSLLHLHEAEDLVSCFRSVRRHLAPGARFVFDVFMVRPAICRRYAASTLHLRVRVMEGGSTVSVKQNSPWRTTRIPHRRQALLQPASYRGCR